jgi:ribosomal protein S19
MTNEQKEIYQDTGKLKQLLKQLNGKKLQLYSGHHVTFGHFLGNDITIYNGNRFKIICSLCGY